MADIEPQPKPKRILTPEQLEKLAKGRAKSQEVRKKNAEINKIERQKKKIEKQFLLNLK